MAGKSYVSALCPLWPLWFSFARTTKIRVPPSVYNPNAMDPARIAELLHPFLELRGGATATEQLSHSEPAATKRSDARASEESAVLSPLQLRNISTYIDLLAKWNARINLTSVHDPEQIVTRHFGESLFAARHLFPSAGVDPSVGSGPGHVGPGLRPGQERSSAPPRKEGLGPASPHPGTSVRTPSLIDLGSGAGFPGLPIKIWSPQLRVTLIESNQKKFTFLREVIRSLSLTAIDVFGRRAEDYPPALAEVVTLRAVERFDAILPVAARLVAPSGRLAILIGRAQADSAMNLTPNFNWSKPLPIPQSTSRILMIAHQR